MRKDKLVELQIGTEVLCPALIEDLTSAELLESEGAQVLKGLELLDALPKNEQNTNGEYDDEI